MCICCECCVLSGREVYRVGLITSPEKSYCVWCALLSVIVNTQQWGDPGPLRAVAPLERGVGEFVLFVSK